MQAHTHQQLPSVTGTGARGSGLSKWAQWLILFGLLAFAFACGFTRLCGVDIGFHIRTGAEVLATHAIPATNTFSYTQPNQPWLLHQWPAGVLFDLVFLQWGIPGLVFLKALIAVGLALLMFLACDRRGRTHLLGAAIACTLALLFMRTRFYVRPLLFTALCLGMLSLGTAHARGRRSWALLGIPLLLTCWGHIHAGVLYGYLFVAGYAAADLGHYVWQRFRRGNQPSLGIFWLELGGVGIALAATALTLALINPNGPKVLLLPIPYFLDPFWQQLIAEFHPPPLAGYWLFYLWVAALAILCVMRRHRVTAGRLIVTAGFAVLALKSQRAILMFGVVSAPLMASLITPSGPLPPLRIRLLTLLAPILWAVALVGIVLPDPTFRPGIGLFPGYHPTGLYALMREDIPRQHVYNDMRYGAGMLWWLYPNFRPFIDGRCEAYSKVFWRDVYVPTSRGDAGWKKTFAHYNVTGALVPAAKPGWTNGLAAALCSDPDWAVVGFTDSTLLLLKRTATNQATIDRLEYASIAPPPARATTLTRETSHHVLEEANRALAIDPQSVVAGTARARALLLSDAYREAADAYADLISQHDVSPAYWRDYAFALYRAADYATCEEVLGHMIARGTELAYSHYLMHLVCLQANRREEALSHIRKAAELAPENTRYTQAAQRLSALLAMP